ncbi:MAG: hypothetical protein HY315_06955 [Acidobacteria bacterium]|nr:hypothetical protein [Acidobacteriota bacterium]
MTHRSKRKNQIPQPPGRLSFTAGGWLLAAVLGILLVQTVGPAAGGPPLNPAAPEQNVSGQSGDDTLPGAWLDDPQLPFLEAIRSDHPERLFDLLKQNSVPLEATRKLALQALARYRLGDFDRAEELLAKIDGSAAESMLLHSLLRATEGRLQEAEQWVSEALSHRPALGLLAFEAGLHHSYLLQHLGRPREAAAAIDRILLEAPLGRPALRSIKKSLEASTGEPYRRVATSDTHNIPLLADGSLPPRTVLPLRPGEPDRLVLFDTGSSLTLLKTDIQHDVEAGATALALDLESSTDFSYGWQKSLAVDGWQMENIPVGFVERKSEKSAGLNYEAVFGLPFLRHFFVVFDFPGRSMQLLARVSERIEGKPIPFRYVADQMLIRATVNGRPAHLLIDTGLALPFLRLDTSWAPVVAPPPPNLPARPALPLPAPENQSSKGSEPLPPLPKQQIEGVSAWVTSLKFGDQEMKNLPVALDILDRRMNQNPLAVRIDGILAAPLLKDYVVSIDFEANRIYFQKAGAK